MTQSKKLLIALGALAAPVLLGLGLAPLLLRGPVEARARTGIEEALAARVAWSDAGLSLFADFPNLTLTLDDLAVVGVDAFEGDTLVAVPAFRLVLDLGSVVRSLRGKGAVVVRSIRLADPDVRLRVLDDGSANWDILRGDGDEPRETVTGSGGRGVRIQLREFAVTDGSLLLEDPRSGLYVALEGVRHTLSGDFSQERLTARTATSAQETTVRFAGLPYLEGVGLDFRADLDADMVAGRFAVADNELRLNDLVVGLSGTATTAGDSLALDVAFQAPRTEFAQILSLVPVVYAHDFASLETSGAFTLAGTIGGWWGDGTFPSFSLDVEVSDGMFKYPDLPLPARDIGLRLAMRNPGGDVDSTVIRMERLHVRIGDQPLDASLTLRTPVSDPDVDFSVVGAVDLADVGRTVKLPEVQELTGTVRADAAVRARLSDVDAARWDRIGARGTVAVRDVTMRAEALAHPVSIEEATLVLTPQRAELRSLRMLLGSSDVRASGSLDNVLGHVLRKEPLAGRATFASRFVDLDEWRSEDSRLELIPVPAGFDLALSGTVDSLAFGDLRMTEARGDLQVEDQRLTLDGFTLRTLGGRVALDGFYDTVDPERPAFNVDVSLDSLDIGGASAAFVTVRALAPVARFAQGAFDATLSLEGVLGEEMHPVFDALDGSGSLHTTPLRLEGFPAMGRLAEALQFPQLASPTLAAIRSSLVIEGGRLRVRPFQVRLGDILLGVEGGNGIDGSMDYDLSLTVPRALLGGAADQAVRALVSQAGRAGIDLQAADSVELSARLSGTVTDPTVAVAFSRALTSAGDRAQAAVGAAVQERLGQTEARADSAAAAALASARARADSLLAAAEVQAVLVREEARRAADALRTEADQRAEQLVAAASNPVARAAARTAADRLRREADQRAEGLILEADRRAEALLAEARTQADEIVRRAGGTP